MSRDDNPAGRKVLVTGASGFLGRRIVAVLSARGAQVHALVREASRIDRLLLPNVTLFRGDVAVADSLHPAFAGVEYVVHAAADTSGSAEAGRSSTVRGTATVLELCERHKVGKLVHISSCSVYGISDYPPWQVVTEESSLERFPERRGAYSHAKLEAERLVARAMERGTVPAVCLRPGTIYGPGGEPFTPMMGFSLGRTFFAVIGDGSFVLPLVYVDNLVEAILAAMLSPASTGKFYNVVDPAKVTKRDYMEAVVRRLYPAARTLYLPLGLLKTAVSLQAGLFRALKKAPVLTTYRLMSSQKPVIYDASRIARELGWKPAVSLQAASAAIIAHETHAT
jgi:nucleoside-diphosphate-sugar epimerase